jgi:hypothetical protein
VPSNSPDRSIIVFRLCPPATTYIHACNPINGRQEIEKLEREWTEKKITGGRSPIGSSLGLIREKCGFSLFKKIITSYIYFDKNRLY